MNLYKTVENMLIQLDAKKCEIKNILIEIDEVESNFRGISAIQYSDMPKSSNITSSVEKEIEQKEKRIEYLNQLIIKKENEIRRVENALEVLTEDEYKLIEMRYFKKIPNNKIAEILNLTEQTTSIMKGRIINKLIKLMFF